MKKKKMHIDRATFQKRIDEEPLDVEIGAGSEYLTPEQILTYEAFKKIGNGAVRPTRLVKDGPRTYAEEVTTKPKLKLLPGLKKQRDRMRAMSEEDLPTESLTCDGCGKASRWAVIDHECTARLEYCTECWPYD